MPVRLCPFLSKMEHAPQHLQLAIQTRNLQPAAPLALGGLALRYELGHSVARDRIEARTRKALEFEEAADTVLVIG